MALYFLTYDLRNNRDYQTLYDELDRFSALRVLESTWCFNRFGTNAIKLRDHFKKFIDNDDGLLVDESTGSWGTSNAEKTPRNLP